jgi:hypothetical protein
MAGLNLRLNKEGTRLFFQNRPNFIANIDLTAESLEVERVYSTKELDSLVKFEADVVGSDIVALSSNGLLKVSEKNLCYKISTESKNPKFPYKFQKFKKIPYKFQKKISKQKVPL